MASLSDSLQNLASGAKIGAQKIYGQARKEVLSGLSTRLEETVNPSDLSEEELQAEAAENNEVKQKANIAAQTINIYNKAKTAVSVAEFLIASWPAILAIIAVIIVCGLVFYVATILPHATPVVSQKLQDDPSGALVYKTLCDNAMYNNQSSGALPTFSSIDQCFTYLDCTKNTEAVGADSNVCITAITTSPDTGGNTDNPGGGDNGGTNPPVSPTAFELGINQTEITAACTLLPADKLAKYGDLSQCTPKLTCEDLEAVTGRTYNQCHL